MAIYTFSTKETKPADKELVDRVKQHCAKNDLNFSAFIISMLRDWEKANERK